MSVVTLVSTKEQAAAAVGSARGGHVVAVTAEAYDSLAGGGARVTAVGDLVDSSGLEDLEGRACTTTVRLLAEVEARLAEVDPAARAVPGFLSDQAYPLSWLVLATLTRVHLARDACRALDASRVVISAERAPAWMAGDLAAFAPWVEATRACLEAEGVAVQVLDDPGTAAASSSRSAVRREQARRAARRAAAGALRLATRARPGKGGRSRISILAAGGPYEWEQVFVAAPSVLGAVVWRLHRMRSDPRGWTSEFAPALSGPRSTRRITVEPQAARGPLPSTILDEWSRDRALDGDVDLVRGLLPHLLAVAAESLPLARRADALAKAALESVEPDAVCFDSISSLAEKRLVRASRSAGVPAIAYQHGGTYGTHRYAHHELADFGWADVFFAFGPGVRPRTSGVAERVPRFVPVGSLRVEQARRRPRARGRRSCPHVLWVAEVSFSNTVPFVVEDTLRYRLELAGLGLLDRGGLDVTYRPFPGQAELGTVARRLVVLQPGVRIDAVTPLVELVRRADVVITLTSSNTIWNDVVALGVPLLVYADPVVTPLEPDFAADLETACHWCRSPGELLDVVGRLASSPAETIRELGRHQSGDYLCRYVLTADDGRCLDRVLDGLSSTIGPRETA